MCQLPTPLIEGSEGLEAIFRGLERGDSRKNIGLEYTPRPNAGKLQDILDNLNAVTPFPPLPIEAMKRLEGGDAEWLRAQLFSRMNDEGRSSFYYRYRRVITEELNPVLHTPLTVAQREARGLENDEDAICVRVGSRWIPTLIAVKPAGWRTILDEEEKLAIERSKQSIDANDDPAYENDWLQELRGFLKELD
jgi:hypothetical protein